MRDQLTGFQISIAIHAVAVLLILAVNNSFTAGKHVVIIDFDIESGSGIRHGIGAKAVPGLETGSGSGGYGSSQPEVKVDAETKNTQNLNIGENVIREPRLPGPETAEHLEQSRPTVSVDSVQEKQTAGSSAASLSIGGSGFSDKNVSGHDRGLTDSGQDQGSLSGGTGARVGLSGDMKGSVSGTEGYGPEMAEYSKEVYRKISKGIVYPQRARDMGWEGSVGVSFYVLRTGRAKDIKLEKSSGWRILDQRAIDFVRGCKFPKPPGEAWMSISVLFKLK